MQQSVYDSDQFFELYQKLRANPNSLNNVVEMPTMLSLLPDLTGKKLLDLGCGTGEHLAQYLVRQADYLVGIDLSQAMLQAAQQRLNQIQQAENRGQKFESFSPRFELHQLAMEQLSQLAEQDFDLITSSFAFHYVADFEQLLRDIYAKLKPQGWLIFSQEHPIVTAYQGGERWEKDENKQQLAYRLNFYRDEGERDRRWFKQPFTTYHRTTATLLNSLIKTGFQIEQVAEPMLAEQPEWQQEFKDLQHRPVLFFVKARKR